MPVILRCHPDLNNLKGEKTMPENRDHPLTRVSFDMTAPLSFLLRLLHLSISPDKCQSNLMLVSFLEEKRNMKQFLTISEGRCAISVWSGIGGRRKEGSPRQRGERKGEACLTSNLWPPVYLFIHFNLSVAPNDPKQIVGQPGLVPLFSTIRTFIHTFNIFSNRSWAEC